MGFLDGLRGYFGTQQGELLPQAPATPGPDMSMGQEDFGGAPGGVLQEQPQMRGPDTSFLDRLGRPDARGLTFGDKLFAAGSVMQGDSGGAASYLQNQRATADVVSERERKRELAMRSLAALRKNFKGGQFNYEGYLADMPNDGDPTEALAMATKLAPEVQVQNMGANGMYETRRNALGGETSTRELVAPRAHTPGLLLEDGVTPNMPLILATAMKAGETAKAQAPYRAKPRGRSTVGPKPKTWMPQGATLLP